MPDGRHGAPKRWFQFRLHFASGPQPDCLSDLVASNRLVEAELSPAAGNPQRPKNDQGSGIGRLCTLTVYRKDARTRFCLDTAPNYFTCVESSMPAKER